MIEPDVFRGGQVRDEHGSHGCPCWAVEDGVVEVFRFREASGAECGEMSMLPHTVGGQVTFVGSELAKPPACETVEAH